MIRRKRKAAPFADANGAVCDAAAAEGSYSMLAASASISSMSSSSSNQSS